MQYTKSFESSLIFSDDLNNGKIVFNNPIKDDYLIFVVNFLDDTKIYLKISVLSSFYKWNFIAFNLENNIFDWTSNTGFDYAFNLNLVSKELSNSTLINFFDSEGNLKDITGKQFFIELKNIPVKNYILYNYNLSLPSYIDVYEDLTSVEIPSNIKYTSYNDMIAWLQYQNNSLQESTQTLLNRLILKLDTLDNLDILASADFSPLQNLTEFSNLLGTLNPVLQSLLTASNILNDYTSSLLPVRAKFGQPVEPLSKVDKVYSFIDYNHMTINRLITNQSQNSKIYLYDVSSSKLLKVLYDIDYSMTFDVKDYKSLRIVFDANDYVIDKAL